MVQPLAIRLRPKMETNTSMPKRKFLQPMKWGSMHLRGPCCFLVGVAMGVLDYFCCSQCVPMKFTFFSHQVLNDFLTFSSSSWCVPQCVPNSSSLIPKSFALSFTLAIYITNPKEEITTYLFWDCWKVE